MLNKKVLSIVVVSVFLTAFLMVLICPASELDKLPAGTPCPYFPDGVVGSYTSYTNTGSVKLGYGRYLRQNVSLHFRSMVQFFDINQYTDYEDVTYHIQCFTWGATSGEAYGENNRIYLPAGCSTSAAFGDVGKVCVDNLAVYDANYEFDLWFDDSDYRIPLSQTWTYPQTESIGGYQNFSVLHINVSSTEPQSSWFLLAEFDLQLRFQLPTVSQIGIDVDATSFFTFVQYFFLGFGDIFNAPIVLALADIAIVGYAVTYVVRFSL